MGFVKIMKQHFTSEMDDVYSKKIKFHLFILNVIISGGAVVFECHDFFFKEPTEKIVELTSRKIMKVRNGVAYVSQPKNFIYLYFQFHY